MTEPIRSGAPAPEPTVVDLEPITITASPASGPPAAPLPIGELAAECLSEFAGIAAAGVTGLTNPLAGIVVGFKAGLDLGECAADAVQHHAEQASIRHAIETCVAEGGTPIGLLPGELTCAVPAEAP